MKKVIPLRSKDRIDYHRKHDLTHEEIRESPLFSDLNDGEIANVAATFKQMCQILVEYIENQYNVLEFETNSTHIAAGKLIELNSPKTKAA